jgi:hypothetical protein
MMQKPATINEFAAIHGEHLREESAELALQVDKATYLFRNGAKWVQGTAIEPPTNPAQLAIAKRRYFNIAIERTSAEFRHVKHAVLTAAERHVRFPHAAPMPGAEVVAVLKRLKSRLDEWRAELDTLPKLPDPAEKRRAEIAAQTRRDDRTAIAERSRLHRQLSELFGSTDGPKVSVTNINGSPIVIHSS